MFEFVRLYDHFMIIYTECANTPYGRPFLLASFLQLIHTHVWSIATKFDNNKLYSTEDMCGAVFVKNDVEGDAALGVMLCAV